MLQPVRGTLTPDLGGTCTKRQITESVLTQIEQHIARQRHRLSPDIARRPRCGISQSPDIAHGIL